MTGYVITATRGPVTVTFWLHGDVDAARIAREQQIANHRADQLNVKA